MELKNTNILILLEYGALGGAERQALGLAKYLTEERNCSVDLFLLKSDFQTDEFSGFVKYSKIRNVYHFGEPYLFLPREYSFKNLRRLKWNISYLLKLRKGLKNNGYTLAIPFLNYTSKIAYCLYRLIPSIKITFWHQLGLDILKNDLIESYIAHHVPFVIGNAPNCFDIFKNEYPINKNKLNLLPQYLTLEVKELDKNKLKSQFYIPQNSVIIGMIAHYRVDKYFNLLLEAYVKLISNKKLNVHLVLLGNKENNMASNKIYENLIQLSKDLKISNQVSVLSGYDVRDVLNVLDIGVLVSQIEGMPNTVMEYMAYGLPCVVSNHPGCVQLLEDSPFLIQNNVDLLAYKLQLLIENVDLRTLEGLKNKQRITKFSLPNYVSDLEKIISKYI